MNIVTKRFGLAAAVTAALALMTAGRVEASTVITLEQSGSNVVMTGSGSLNITGMTFDTSGLVNAGVTPGEAGAFPGALSANVDIYLGLTGPTSFGSGGFISASSGSGGLFGVQGNGGFLEVPMGYVSGASLSATDTFNNKTLSGLGLTPGTYTFNLPHDTLTVEIGVAAVPEPSTLTMASIGALTLAGCARRRRRVRA